MVSTHKAVASGQEPTLVDERSVTDRGRRSGGRAPERGSALGRYVLLERLGAGGMGVVYAAYDPDLDRKVALKLLHAERSDPVDSDRLVREAQALARLSHPNVVAVHDVGIHEGQVFVAMEFVDGTTLRTWMGDARTWRDVVQIFLEAGEGLAAAHDKSLVHRDFKPDNVMIGEDGRVRVMDFGLARGRSGPRARADATQSMPGLDSEDDDGDDDRDDDDPISASRSLESSGRLDRSLTRAGGIVGTPAYMAPEQHERGEIDAAADQFAFCVALFEALYGRRPFEGKSLAALMHAVAHGELTMPDDERGVPGALRQIVLRGLSVEPSDRFPTMRALLDALAIDPVRRRRRLLGSAAGLLLLGGIFGLDNLAERRTARHCAEQGAAIEASWNDGKAKAVERGLLDAGRGNAEQTATRTRRWLDDYAEAWRSTRDDVCLAADHQAWSEDLLTSAESCFEIRRAHFDALVTVLSDADEVNTAAAVRAASSIPSVRSCADETWLSARVGSSVELGRRAAELDARQQAARSADRDQAQALVEAAAEAGDTPVQANALLGLARGARRDARWDDARTHTLQAHLVAGQTPGAEELAAQAAAELTVIHALGLDAYDEALRWAAIARMWFSRAGIAEDDLRRALLHDAHGVTLELRGDYEPAREQYRRAIEIRTQELGEDHPSVAKTLNNLANTYLRENDFERAAQHYRDALDAVRTSLGPRHLTVAAPLNNLALALMQLGQLAEALEHAREALEIRIDVLGPEHAAVASSHTTIAILLADLGHAEAAVERYELSVALTRTTSPDSVALADALRGQGNALLGVDRAADGVTALEESLAIYEATLPTNHPEVAYTRLGLARALAAAGRIEDATREIVRVQAEAEANADIPGLLGRAQYEHARIRRAAGDLGGALAKLEQAEPLLREAGRPELPQAIATVALRGRLLVELGRAAEGQPLIDQARAELDRSDLRPPEKATVNAELAG